MKSYRIIFTDASVLAIKADGYQLKFEASKPHHYDFTAESGVVATLLEAQVRVIIVNENFDEYLPMKG
jgi:hypothetical protein